MISDKEMVASVSNLSIFPWNGVSIEDVLISVVTGGLTNTLYCIKLKNGGTDPKHHILVRVFGVSDGMLNRQLENEIFTILSAKGISPKLLGQTDWGRFEEFLVEHKPLPNGLSMVQTGPDVDMVFLIAQQLAILHHLEVPSSVASADVFEVMSRWLLLASRYSTKIVPSATCPNFVLPTIDRLAAEIEFVRDACLGSLANKVRTSPLCMQLFKTVLCHNDMLSGNLMFNPADKSLRLIDFEYSGFNYAAADLANLLCAVSESILISGEAQNVKLNFPSVSVQLHLLRCYFDLSEIPQDEQAPLLAVLAGFVLADELRWTIWNIIQENQSSIPFDYCRCYNSRFSAYLDYKEMFAQRIALL